MKRFLTLGLVLLSTMTLSACFNNEDDNDETAPVITTVSGKTFEFDEGTNAPDWKTYFTVLDDIDGVITITDEMLDTTDVDMDTVGTFDIVFTVEDVAGNSSTQTITITINQIVVVDETIPVITLVADLATEFDQGATAPDWKTYITATDDVDGVIAITDTMVDDANVDMSTVGTFDVSFTVPDSSGNFASVYITITILDITAPVITEVAALLIEFESGATAPDWKTYITALDDIDGNITITDAMVDTTNVDMDTVGTFDIVFTVEDVAGNSSTTTITITIIEAVVIDVTDPIITEVAALATEFEYGSTAPDWKTYVTASDNADGSITITDAMVDTSNVDMDTVGTFDIVFTVEDVAGNSATTTITITIVDTAAPVLTLVGALPVEFAEGTVEPDWTVYVTADDDYDGVIVITVAMIDVSTVDMNTPGTFDLIYTVTDTAGNTSTETITMTITETAEYTLGTEVFNYQFDVADSGTLALPTLLEGNGYYVNDAGYAETVYMQDSSPIFGDADSWTFVSNGYDQGMAEFVLEAKVTALGHANAGESPIFSVRVDYDWMLDVHFNFNNSSWSGVAVHNVPDGSVYSNDAAKGGLAPNLVLDLNTEYVFKIVVRDSDVIGQDMLIIYVDNVRVIATYIPDVNLNAQHIMGASLGSHIQVDYFKGNLIDVINPPEFAKGEEKYNYQFDVADNGTLAFPTLLEGNGYYVNDAGYAETVYMQDSSPIFGEADAWTFMSNGYDQGMEEFVIETKVTALGHTNTDESPIFSVRIDYDWLMDIHFNFNNNSWSGVAVHNVPDGSVYSNDAAKGGLAPNLVLDLNTEYVFKIVVKNSEVVGEDILVIYVDGVKVIETVVPNVNLNAQHIIGASYGSHIKIDYITGHLIAVPNAPLYAVGEAKFDYQFDVVDSGNLAIPTLLEGNGYYVNDSGYAETVYMQDSSPIFGEADAWTFMSNGYDQGMEEFVIETKVTALSHTNPDEAPIFSIRIDYDWLLDIHFSFNNNSWSGVAAHGVPTGSVYSNDATKGGLAPDLALELNTEYVFKIVITSSDIPGEDTLMIYVDDVLVIHTNVPNVNLNAQHIMGCSYGSHIQVDYFKGNLIEVY